jgi:hypothetical protein
MRIRFNGRNRNGLALTNEDIQKYAPSAFAGQAHDSRSDRYTFIPTSGVIDGLLSEGFVPTMAMQSRTRVEGKQYFTKHMIRFQNPEMQSANVGDSTPEVVLINSHDGTSAYKVMLGVFRLVCSNGMVVAESMAASVNVRHTGNIIEQVVTATKSLVAFAPRVAESIKLWKSIELSLSEQIVLAEGALALRYDGEIAPVTPDSVLRVQRYADNGNDLYTVFNRIQEGVIRGGQRTYNPETGRNGRTREVKGIDQNTKLNQQLFALAEKMAAIKSGK